MAYGQKTGGRQKGTPNKSTTEFRLALERANFSIPNEAIQLYRTTGDEAIQVRLLEFLASYSKAKPKEDPEEDPIDITPEEEALSDETLLLAASPNANPKSKATPLETKQSVLEASLGPKDSRKDPKGSSRRRRRI